jgi:hypothetical protein
MKNVFNNRIKCKSKMWKVIWVIENHIPNNGPFAMHLATTRLAFRQGLLQITYLQWTTYSATAVSCVTILMVQGVLSFFISFKQAATISSMLTDSDVSGQAQSPEPGPARPSKARPEAGLGSGFQ